MFERIYFAIGFLLFFLPIIGVWSNWKEWSVAVVGLCILVLSTISMLSDRKGDDANKESKQ